MGWEIGFDGNWNRDVGYGVPAICDHPGCNEKIDRGLAFVCGGEPMGGDKGCGLYFCGNHLSSEHQRCERCQLFDKPFEPKPDTDEWVQHKLTDPSWQEWRESQPVDRIKGMHYRLLGVDWASGSDRTVIS